METFEFIIVGAGFSGLGAAIKLKQNGFDDFVILERADDLGGTWRDNTYPGIAVDVTSFIYSYPFEPNTEWSRTYAPGNELKSYADFCADKYAAKQHIRYGQQVEKTVYDETANRWLVYLTDGRCLSCQYFISACGLLVEPKMPDIEGIESFQGKIVHSARWDHSYSMDNRKVAVIGTGASAVQIIPAIAEDVESLHVFQRTPIWAMPKPDYVLSRATKTLFKKLPFIQKIVRAISFFMTELIGGVGIVYYKKIPWLFRLIEKIGLKHLHKQVNDPELLKKLTPDYTFFCKRPTFSNNYYSTFTRPNVELNVEPIVKITSNAIVTDDGKTHEVDAIICATGFHFFDRGSMPTFEVVGKEGINLGDFWLQNRFQSYEGATLPGFPNYFMIMGPYAVASASYFGMIDTQVHHMMRCLKEAQKQDCNYIEVKQAALDKSQNRVFKQMENTVFVNGNCGTANSYYFDRHGDAPLIRPVNYIEMWWKSRTFPLDHYSYLNK